MNMDRAEARHELRTYRAIGQAFERVPAYRLFAAAVNDPHLATHLYEREKSIAELESQRDKSKESMEVMR